MTQSTVDRVRLWTRVQVVLLIVFGSLTTFEIIRVETLARGTHSALCAFETDLRGRADSSQDYLDKHPGKYPIHGVQITRSEIKRQISSQRATLRSLSGLGCPTPNPKGATP